MIFEFNNYRNFLKTYIKQKPKRGYGEATRIAKHINVSTTFFSQVLSGIKQLSVEQTQDLSEYLGLSELESEYFFYLVNLDRAGTQNLKKFYEKKLQLLKADSLKLTKRVEVKKILSEEEKSIFYSSYLYSAILLFTSTKETGVTLEEIENRFEIKRKRSAEIMRFLTDCGMCKIEKSFFKLGTQSTHAGTESIHHTKHHVNWRLKAIQKTESLSEHEMMYTVQVSLSQKDFIQLREEMVQFIKKFLDTIHPSPAEDIANLNLDWFWIEK